MNSLLVRLMEQPLLAKYLERYRSLEARERIAILGLGTFLGLVFICYGLWIPLVNYASESSDRHANRQEMLQWMQSTEAEARANSGVKATSGRSGLSLLTVVSRMSRSAEVQPTRMQQEGGEEVSVWFEDVEFGRLLSWMDKLRQEGVGVRQLSIDRQEEEGKVSARIVLRT